MRNIILPLLLVSLMSSCMDLKKEEKVHTSPRETITGTPGLFSEKTCLYIYNHRTNSDVIYLGFDYTKEQLDSVFGKHNSVYEENDDLADFADYACSDKGVHLGFFAHSIVDVILTKDTFALHINDGQEIKVGDKINDLNIAQYAEEIRRVDKGDTTRIIYHMLKGDGPDELLLDIKNDVVVGVSFLVDFT